MTLCQRSVISNLAITVFRNSRFCSSMSNQLHTERTKEVSRTSSPIVATIRSIEDISPTVRALRLWPETGDGRLSFLPGQWVDVRIGGVDVVGGFTICSAPFELDRESSVGGLTLAVKRSSHPPAHWIHTQAKLNDRLTLSVGGEFHFDPSADNGRTRVLNLIAGGVGINPLSSIIWQTIHHDRSNAKGVAGTRTINLLYSAANADELIFKADFQRISRHAPDFHCIFFVTKETTAAERGVLCRRIGEGDLKRLVDNSRSQPSVADGGYATGAYYVCGPPPMIENCEAILRRLGVDETAIHSEKWW